MEKALVARWESRSRKHWVDLYRDAYGYTYSAPDCGGNLGALQSDTVAIDVLCQMVERGYFQPDANKTPMHRAS